MNRKFLKVQQKLGAYKDKFAKNKRTLQQDHDSFVKIKKNAEHEISE